jgi:biotin carboxylase
VKNVVLVGGHDETFTHFAGLGFEFSVLQRPALIGENLRRLTNDIHPVPDFEPDTVVAEIERIIGSKRVDYIFSFTESGLLPAALASHRFAIPGISLAACELCIDKIMMRDFLSGSEFAIASAICRTATDVETFFDRHRRGMVLKDPTGSGSEAVFVVRNEHELATALTELGREDFVMLAEEYLSGREVSVETLTIDGKHRILAVTNKKLHRDTLAEEQHVISPDVVDAEQFHEISDYCDRLLTRIDHRHGPCHIEVKIADDGIHLIEINNRVGGDYIGLLVELTTGVSQVRETLRCRSDATQSNGDREPRAVYTHAASHQFYEPTEPELLRKAMPGVDIVRLHVDSAKFSPGRPRTNQDKVGWIVLAGNEPEAFNRAIDYLDRHCS